MRQHPVRRRVAIRESFQIDDNFFAGVDPAFQGRRTHVRQKRNLARLGEPHELGRNGRFVLENVETRPGDGFRFDKPDQPFFINNFTSRCIHDDSAGAQKLQPARGQKMKSGGRVRTIDRYDIHPRQHLVE